MTIIYRQCNKVTETKITPGRTNNVDCQAWNLIEFLKQICTVCFGSNNRGLPFGPYKQIISVKLMNNYSNNKPHDPHGSKEKIKIKIDAVKALVEQIPNRIGAMIKLL